MTGLTVFPVRSRTQSRESCRITGSSGFGGGGGGGASFLAAISPPIVHRDATVESRRAISAGG